ncbi:pepsin/retropepsin-like aspartic protease family protein [Alteromonas lipolytica]|uniref:Signal protein PDZ n=1 Tax=Alteromonas lipolytica TaxID=1856405 RepID=A0A1E8FB52_9ALTE|nr:pepsin/retropepsin-like aspartic protease family protein [Alteromonas lipolytica]OFI33162.1 signal protein PDZ [Alteromonas lipolytica]GGF61972.1 hypothetical protein GCM10011338_12920 [Alteromonas lipolytica]
MKYLFALVILLTPLRLFAAATQWADFTLINGHIYLPVTVEGVETKVMLDSGAQIHAINKAFIGKHNLALSKGSLMRIRGVNGTENRTAYNNVNVNLFGVDFELDKVVEFSMGRHTTGMLLGASFFYPFIVQINYPDQKIRLITRDSVDMSEVANVRSMDDRGSGMPIAEIEINGKPFWFLVDTGSNAGILMERRYAAQAGLLDEVDGSTITRGVNRAAVQDYATAKTVQFGPFEITDVKVLFPAEGETSNLENQFSATGTRIKGKKVVGILGYGLFKHFLLTLDYKPGKLHVDLPPE